MGSLSILPKLLRTIRNISIVTLLLPFAAFLTAQTTDSPEITKLLEQVRSHAAMADKDGATLESYTRSNVSLQTHANRLNQIKEHTNSLIKDFNELSEMRDQGSQWQQEAIDQIRPLLQIMSDHLTATIKHLSENQAQIHLPDYQNYVHANSKMLSAAHGMISDYLDYGEAKSKVDMLEQKLLLAAPVTPGE